MSIIALLIILALSGFVGFKFGPEIHGTTIGGLKFAFVFWSAVIGLAIGALVGLAFLGLGALTGIASVGLLASIAAGFGGGLVGCGIGYLAGR
jgi:hypothetical protein